MVNALGFVVIALLTRMLGTDGFGQYSTVFAYLFFVSVAADVGLGTLLTREISRPDADEARVVGSLVALRLLLVTLAALVGCGIAVLLPYPHVIHVGIFITSLTIIAQSVSQVLMGVFQKHLRISIAATGDIITRAVQLIGLFLLWDKGIAYLLPVLWVNVIAEIIHAAIMYYSARRIVPFRLHVDWSYWREMLRHAFPIAASLIFTLIYFKIDTIMLSLMRTSQEVGVYAVAYKILEVIIFFPAMYVGLIMPLLSRHADDEKAFGVVFRRAFLVLGGGAIATIAVLLIFAGPMIQTVGGSDFAHADTVLRILSLGIGLIFLGNLGGNAIIALNLQRSAMWVYGAGAAFNVAANFYAIPHYGYYGAAWTTVATEAIVTIGMFALIREARARRVGRL